MSDDIEELLHDGASLHRFIDFIDLYCRENSNSQVYIDSAGLFFRYINLLARGLKAKLEDEVQRAIRSPSRLSNVRSEILTLKYYLRLLHTLVKPVADAHTLNIPAPLIDLASRQLRRVQGMDGANIVILLTPELMYFQRPHTDIKNIARSVEGFIPEATFPSKLGFVELPYSQGPSFFTNLALYHEIGHFVYEELSGTPTDQSGISELRHAIGVALQQHSAASPSAQAFAVQVQILENWTQEIFCDLFAIHLLGPAFSFSLLEILGLLGLLRDRDYVIFNPTHPAAACRLGEHLRLLRDAGWENALSDVHANSKRLLEHIAQMPMSSYEVRLDDQHSGPRALVDAFIAILPRIREVVKGITTHAAADVEGFGRLRSSIQDSLGEGVVPSRRVQGVVPDPVSIINASFCFYLTSLSGLMGRFEGPLNETPRLESRSQWMNRLEMWTMKAIEDSQLPADVV